MRRRQRPSCSAGRPSARGQDRLGELDGHVVPIGVPIGDRGRVDEGRGGLTRFQSLQGRPGVPWLARRSGWTRGSAQTHRKPPRSRFPCAILVAGSFRIPTASRPSANSRAGPPPSRMPVVAKVHRQGESVWLAVGFVADGVEDRRRDGHDLRGVFGQQCAQTIRYVASGSTGLTSGNTTTFLWPQPGHSLSFTASATVLCAGSCSGRTGRGGVLGIVAPSRIGGRQVKRRAGARGSVACG